MQSFQIIHLPFYITLFKGSENKYGVEPYQRLHYTAILFVLVFLGWTPMKNARCLRIVAKLNAKTSEIMKLDAGLCS